MTYTVTAEDSTTADYTVAVDVAKIASVTAVNGDFTSPNGFKQTGSDISGVITGAITSVTGTDGLGTVITLVAADYSVDVLNPAVVGAGTTATLRVPADRSSTGADMTKDFTVYIKDDAKAITAFTITSPVSAAGTINEASKTITVTVPYGTDITKMKPALIHTGKTISPAGETERDFTYPVTYTVTAEDGTDQNYKVTVKAAPGITISGITVKGLPSLKFTGAPSSPVDASTIIIIDISGDVTVDSWYIGITGPAFSTSVATKDFAAPGTSGFYNINVIATVGGVPYSGSFGLIVK
jgi:hypothetical protein